MKRLKIVLVFVIVLLIIVLYFSCGDLPTEETETNTAVQQINPVSEAVSRDRMTTRLYFGYFSERLLVGENRTFDVPVNESTETSIINELIKGPSATRSEFTQLINPATRVVGVESQSQFLFVTLSSEFIEPFGREADPNDEEAVENEKTRKYLAVYSIVNTIIEQGTYSRVGIMVEENGIGRQLTMEEAGLAGTGVTDSFERNGDIELNGQNTAREILTAIEKKEWNTLYGFIANKNAYGQDRPQQEDFTNEVISSRLAVSNYEVIDHVVAQDGQTSIVMINYDLKLQEGEARTLTNVPLRLMQENDVWKISYTVFRGRFLT